MFHHKDVLHKELHDYSYQKIMSLKNITEHEKIMLIKKIKETDLKTEILCASYWETYRVINELEKFIDHVIIPDVKKKIKNIL